MFGCDQKVKCLHVININKGGLSMNSRSSIHCIRTSNTVIQQVNKNIKQINRYEKIKIQQVIQQVIQQFQASVICIFNLNKNKRYGNLKYKLIIIPLIWFHSLLFVSPLVLSPFPKSRGWVIAETFLLLGTQSGKPEFLPSINSGFRLILIAINRTDTSKVSAVELMRMNSY